MQLTEIKAASIPIGLDKGNVSNTVEHVFREWRKTDHGALVTHLAYEVYCELEDAPEEQGMRVNIVAHIPVDDAIAYKLMKTGVDDD